MNSMPSPDQEQTKTYAVAFHGNGAELFKMKVVQILLTLLTLGIYYPWARAATLRYIYSRTEFAGTRFAFHGTGRELFRGFLKAGLVFAVYMGLFFATSLVSNKIAATVITVLIYASFIFLIPVAIYGSLRYRMSRISWRGIRLSYVGSLKQVVMLYLKSVPFTLITLGLYLPFFQNSLRKLLVENTKAGNLCFRFAGTGRDFFAVQTKGIILSVLTLGIYGFWYAKNKFNFLFGKIEIDQDGQTCLVKAGMTPTGVFTNLAYIIGVTVLTLGVGLPWATVRSIRFVLENLRIEGNFAPDKLVQNVQQKSLSATGEGLADAFDIGTALELP